MAQNLLLDNRRSNGYSLIEILVVTGMLTAIMLGSSNYLMTQLKAVNAISYKMSAQELRREIGQHLGKPATCRLSFENLDLGISQEANKIKNSDGSVRWEGGVTYGDVLINRITLEPWTSNDPGNIAVNTGDFQVVLELNATKSVVGSSSLILTILVTGSVVSGDPSDSEYAKLIDCTTNFSGDSSPQNLTDFGYPTGCGLKFRHNERSGGSKEVALKFSAPGYVGINLWNYVNSNDFLEVTGFGCTNSPESFDSYIESKCRYQMATNDWERDNLNGTETEPRGSFKTLYNWGKFKLYYSGDMGRGDKVFARMLCQDATEEAHQGMDKYIREKCSVCLGHSDLHGAMETSSCVNVQGYTPNPRSWATVGFPSHVDGTDSLYFGFTCGNSAPIKSIQ